MGGARATAEDYEFAYAMDRVSSNYMKQRVTLFPECDRKALNSEWSFKSWLEDTPADVAGVKAKLTHRVGMKLACAVGDNLPAVVREETTMLEHLTKDGLIDRFYRVKLGLKGLSAVLGKIITQVTGGATKLVIRDIGHAFSSYTFTDISTGCFEIAWDVLAFAGDKMNFKVTPSKRLLWYRLLYAQYDGTPFPLAIIVSQAVNGRIVSLREPLSLPGIRAAAESEWDLLLVAGQSLGSIQLIEQIIGFFQPSGIKHTVFKTLGDIDTAKFSPKSAILYITQVDKPVFQRLLERTLKDIKRLFETQRTILWITQGCRSEEPFMNMAVGLRRRVVLESPNLMLQLPDLESSVNPSPSNS
ncbi:hypothetical protein BDR22DRAFT_891489 [Usnea florida]